MEAMAVGKPVIATSVGGNPELIRNGENGYLVPPQDAPALGRRIEEFVVNRDKIEPMGKKGRTIAEQMFSLEVMIKNYQDLYQTLLRR
jgi:glycosyltransferase involved in cell wall biosynthesis